MNIPDPFRWAGGEVSLDRLRREFDNMLDRARTKGGQALDLFGLKSGSHVPFADVVELDDEVRVIVDLPGVAPDQVDLSLTGNMLTIRGNRPTGDQPESATTHLCERPRGDFERVLPLPTEVDPDQVNAHADNGVLTVTLGKKQSCRTHSIPIQTATPSTPVM
ncbi:MAG: Hsp20/alpha crystallin family protein [Planctomycetaceae bacterium]|nr:Hsp20/alpha crystallin family protein [Planctomycetaceae bacterium]